MGSAAPFMGKGRFGFVYLFIGCPIVQWQTTKPSLPKALFGGCRGCLLGSRDEGPAHLAWVEK